MLHSTSWFKLAALLAVFSSILFVKSADSEKHSICKRRQPTEPFAIVEFKCPPDNVWFSSSFFTPSQSKQNYCCGSIENRFCCKKSQYKKELYIRQRSSSGMSSLSGTLFTLAFCAIFICICCRCLHMCFRKKRLNQGMVVSSAQGTAAGNINGQNVHVIGQQAPQHPPQHPPQANPYAYTPGQYPPTQYQSSQYAPSPYPPTSVPYPPVSGGYDPYGQQPPPYTPSPVYPPTNPAYKPDNVQQSANDKPAPQPSAPDF